MNRKITNVSSKDMYQNSLSTHVNGFKMFANMTLVQTYRLLIDRFDLEFSSRKITDMGIGSE